MKAAVTILLGCFSLCWTGCFPSYSDDPPERTISGQAVRADTGTPIANAQITFYSGRKRGFSILPGETFGMDAATKSDEAGRFVLVAKLGGKIHVLVQNQEFMQRFDLPAFQGSNRLEGIVWKMSEKKPRQQPQPTRD